jgi:pyridoxamine 5'-phosphate oxidase
MSLSSISEMRVHYAAELFDMQHCLEDPLEQFNIWFGQAVESKLHEPNAMTLATADKSGFPKARIVLLKESNPDGFIFYTNYESHKGQELAENPNVALVFNWLELFRQIRIEGVAVKVSPATSESYFQSRPRGSQVGAWASPQSKVIASREEIEENEKRIEEKFNGLEVLPLPPFWGGYLVRPSKIEFWQGRANRLHDRILYTKDSDNWKRERLAP